MKKLTNEQLQIALRERQGKIEHLELELSNAYTQKETEYYRGYKDMADKTFSLVGTTLTYLLLKVQEKDDVDKIQKALSKVDEYIPKHAKVDDYE